MTAKGDVDQALELHREEMQTYEALGDQVGRANVSFNIGQICLARAMEHNDAAAFQAAYTAMAESYRILLSIGRPDGICAVGAVLGQVLAMGGQRDAVKPVLVRSRDAYRRLGQAAAAAQVVELLGQIG
jgi:hypothetical protein